MTWAIAKKQVKAPNGNVVNFNFDIRQAREVDNLLIVILEVPLGQVMTENVFGVSPEGKLLWQIERIPETSSTPANRYMEILRQNSGHVQVGNWNGGIVDVVLATGKAIWAGWGK